MLKNIQARNADIRRLATEACEHVFVHIPFRGEAEPLSVCDAAYISSCFVCAFSRVHAHLLFLALSSPYPSFLCSSLVPSASCSKRSCFTLQNAGIKFAPHRGITVNLGTGRGCHGRRSF